MQDANTHIFNHATEKITRVVQKNGFQSNFIFKEESISLHTAQPLPSRKAFSQLTGTQFEVTGDELFYFCKDILNLLNRESIILTQVQSVNIFTVFWEKKRHPRQPCHVTYVTDLGSSQNNPGKCSKVLCSQHFSVSCSLRRRAI